MRKYPDDIMKTADQVMVDWWVSLEGHETFEKRVPRRLTDYIAKAILAERERCAKIASNEADRLLDNDQDYPFTRAHDMIVVARRVQFAISGKSNIHLSDAIRARITNTSEAKE
jgi:hypothetical protein